MGNCVYRNKTANHCSPAMESSQTQTEPAFSPCKNETAFATMDTCKEITFSEEGDSIYEGSLQSQSVKRSLRDSEIVYPYTDSILVDSNFVPY